MGCKLLLRTLKVNNISQNKKMHSELFHNRDTTKQNHNQNIHKNICSIKNKLITEMKKKPQG